LPAVQKASKFWRAGTFKEHCVWWRQYIVRLCCTWFSVKKNIIGEMTIKNGIEIIIQRCISVTVILTTFTFPMKCKITLF
jgi:hypothetical protein